MSTKFTLVIRERGGVVFSGDVVSISSVNTLGPFDVLYEHENMVAVIQKTITYRMEDKTEKTLAIDRGILHVKENVVRIFLGV